MTAIVCNCLHPLTHHDIDHFHHFGNDQERKKKVWPNETLSWAYLSHFYCNRHEWDHCTAAFYSCRQWSHSLTKILVPAWNLCFSFLNFKSFFLLAKTFSVFLLINLTIVLCDLEVSLPIWWHASKSLGLTKHQCLTRLIWPYFLNYYQVHSQEYQWKLHYCAHHAEPNHYDLILVWQLCFHFIFSLAFSSCQFLLFSSDWSSHFSDC